MNKYIGTDAINKLLEGAIIYLDDAIHRKKDYTGIIIFLNKSNTAIITLTGTHQIWF